MSPFPAGPHHTDKGESRIVSRRHLVGAAGLGAAALAATHLDAPSIARAASDPDLYVNVTDFGAVGDDAADDTDALQAALNTAGGEKVITAAPGLTFRITSALTLANDRAIIDFNGSTIHKDFQTNFPALFVTGAAADAKFFNLKLVGQGGFQLSDNGIEWSAPGGLMRDCSVTNMGYHGIMVKDGDLLCAAVDSHLNGDQPSKQGAGFYVGNTGQDGSLRMDPMCRANNNGYGVYVHSDADGKSVLLNGRFDQNGIGVNIEADWTQFGTLNANDCDDFGVVLGLDGGNPGNIQGGLVVVTNMGQSHPGSGAATAFEIWSGDTNIQIAGIIARVIPGYACAINHVDHFSIGFVSGHSCVDPVVQIGDSNHGYIGNIHAYGSALALTFGEVSGTVYGNRIDSIHATSCSPSVFSPQASGLNSVGSITCVNCSTGNTRDPATGQYDALIQVDGGPVHIDSVDVDGGSPKYIVGFQSGTDNTIINKVRGMGTTALYRNSGANRHRIGGAQFRTFQGGGHVDFWDTSQGAVWIVNVYDNTTDLSAAHALVAMHRDLAGNQVVTVWHQVGRPSITISAPNSGTPTGTLRVAATGTLSYKVLYTPVLHGLM
jgi:hypothetical protein